MSLKQVRPACWAAQLAARAVSTPIIRTSGCWVLMASVPASKPPPPTGTTTASARPLATALLGQWCLVPR